MNTPLPKPTLDAALADLATNDSFKVVLKFIRDSREGMIADLGSCENPHDVMKNAGGIARMDELLSILDVSQVA